MPCPTLDDLATADALVVVAYDNMQAANTDMNNAMAAYMNAQAAYYAAAQYASYLHLLYLNCQMMMGMMPLTGTRKIGDGVELDITLPMAEMVERVPVTKDQCAPRVELCLGFESRYPQIAAGQRLTNKVKFETELKVIK